MPPNFSLRVLLDRPKTISAARKAQRQRIFRQFCFFFVFVAPALLSSHAGPIRPSLMPSVADAPSNIAEIDTAIEHFQRHDYDRCLTVLKEASKKHPDLLPPRIMLAKLFLLDNQMARGRETLEQAAAANSNHPEVYVLFGKLAFQEARLTDALVHFEKAVTLARSGNLTNREKRTTLIDANAGLAAVAEQRNNWTSAASFLSAWLQLDPKNGKARQRLGQARFQLGRRDDAYAELQRAVQDDSELEPAAITMGELCTAAGDRSGAAAWMETAVKTAPENAKAHLGYARWLLSQDRADEAKAYADRAGRLASESNDVRFVRGLIAWHLHDYETAEQIFQELHRDSPGNLGANNYLALALVQQSPAAKQRQGRELAEMNARLYPNSREALATLGWVYDRLGRWGEAEKSLRDAASTGNFSSDASFCLARLLSKRGAIAESKKLLKSALETRGPFAFRKEAQALAEQLAKLP